MRIDTQELARHYASLSDEALLDVDPADLTETARKVYDEEVARRKLSHGFAPPATVTAPVDFDEPLEIEDEDEPAPEWLETAACACTFAKDAADQGFNAVNARSALRTAGIPCHIVVTPAANTSDDSPRDEYCLMVPGPLLWHAAAVLDRDIFNIQYESEWQTQIEALSDEELSMLKPELFCAGLMDRVARLRSVYEGEMARRGLRAR